MHTRKRCVRNRFFFDFRCSVLKGEDWNVRHVGLPAETGPPAIFCELPLPPMLAPQDQTAGRPAGRGAGGAVRLPGFNVTCPDLVSSLVRPSQMHMVHPVRGQGLDPSPVGAKASKLLPNRTCLKSSRTPCGVDRVLSCLV